MRQSWISRDQAICRLSELFVELELAVLWFVVIYLAKEDIIIF